MQEIEVKNQFSGKLFKVVGASVMVDKFYNKISYFVIGWQQNGIPGPVNISEHNDVEDALNEAEKINAAIKLAKKEKHQSEIVKTYGENLKQLQDKGIKTDVIMSGQDLMHTARFATGITHMIICDIKQNCSAGSQGERKRVFLNNDGYKNAVEMHNSGAVEILLHAQVRNGNLIYDKEQKVVDDTKINDSNKSPRDISAKSTLFEGLEDIRRRQKASQPNSEYSEQKLPKTQKR